ncbi:unnamed protein product [Ambrosiozyma monospora]|uniref:Unnamed protein product n=1 Tax=Ambrosiozyma monospora TaxID=43982 RepID=A0ACB5SXA0_AMBMO|nr:unnamed protein product [Ambrosiozyma monospora]
MTLESAIKKATSSELTEDDWGQLLDIVDLVKSNPDEYITESISVVKSRLNSGNANVILRTVTLIDFLAENCGAMMKGEIAKKAFVNDNLVKLVQDSHTHNNVKYAIIKEIYKLSESFKGDQSLRIMQDTFNDLKRSYQYMCQQAVSEVDNGTKIPPSHGGPGEPATADDEDEELRKAIELSLKESQGTSYRPSQQSQPQQQAPSSNTAAVAPLPQPDLLSSPIGSQGPTGVSAPPPVDNTPAPDKVRALYDLESNDEDTLPFKKDDIITIVETVNAEWLRGCLHGKLGIIPVNYVEKIPPTTDKQLQELTTTLKKSFDIEVLLSQLMDLGTKLRTTAISNQEFESILTRDGIPGRINQVEGVRDTLKAILDLYKLKILELESMSSNVDSSIEIYNKLLAEHAAPTPTTGQPPFPMPTGGPVGQLNQQMTNMNLGSAAPTGFNPQYTGYPTGGVTGAPTGAGGVPPAFSPQTSQPTGFGFQGAPTQPGAGAGAGAYPGQFGGY